MVNDIKNFILDNFFTKKAFLRISMFNFVISVVMVSIIAIGEDIIILDIFSVLTENLGIMLVNFGGGDGRIVDSIIFISLFYIIQGTLVSVIPDKFIIFKPNNQLFYKILGFIYSLSMCIYSVILLSVLRPILTSVMRELGFSMCTYFYMPASILRIVIFDNSIPIMHVLITLFITFLIYLFTNIVCKITDLDFNKQVKFTTFILITSFIICLGISIIFDVQVIPHL